MTRYHHERRKPEWLRSVPRTKPAQHEPGQLLTPNEVQVQHNIREGSEKLLEAIWRRHQRIMLVAQAHGRQVAIPERATK
jgi:hypothetical protein